MRQQFVDRIYADHNQARPVQNELKSLMETLDSDGLGLNVGAGRTKLHPRILNLDVASNPNIDCIGQAERLPFRDAAFSLIVTQETLEHVREPFLAVREMSRVLRPGGILYCQVPFIIGYHPGPTDYWRFTRQGLEELISQAGLHCIKIEVAVGPAVGFYRIATEFVAAWVSRFFESAYLPAKGAAALALYPIKLLDQVLGSGNQRDRIAGGYYVVAKKPG